MPTVNTREYQFAFSLNKQLDIGSVLNVGAINKLRPIRTFAPIVEEHPAVVSDQAWFGKGHSHPTFRDRIQRQYIMNAQERSATALETLYAAAFVMGNVVTIQPDSATNPNEYQHTITWQDQAVNKEVLYTSVAEAMGNEFKKLLIGAWVDEFTMSGNRDDHVTISWTGGGRQYKDTTFPFPLISTSAFYKTLHGLVSFGLADAIVDISAEVLSWTLTMVCPLASSFPLSSAASDTAPEGSRTTLSSRNANATARAASSSLTTSPRSTSLRLIAKVSSPGMGVSSASHTDSGFPSIPTRSSRSRERRVSSKPAGSTV